MREEFCRSEMLLGADGMQRLAASHVLLFGVGGVGGHVAEALARCGVGHITLVDRDTVSLSNLNRQIIALHSTVGLPKVQVMRSRILDINSDCRVDARELFYLPETAGEISFDGVDYVVDAVDNVTAKLDIITRAVAGGIPVISCMGTGNKLHPELLQVADLSKTSVCPLARVMRRELRKRGVEHVKVLYSTEEPLHPAEGEQNAAGHTSPGSVSFVPSVAGLMIAAEVVRTLTGK